MLFAARLAFLAIILGSSVSFQFDPQADNVDEDRIVGGSTATPGQFPYMVSLRRSSRMKDTIVWRHFCGGSIISTNWVVSAAHCQLRGPSSLRLFVGAHHVFNDGTGYAVNQTINHPAYNPRLYRNDIALLETTTPIQLNDRVRPIPLRRQFVDAGVETITTGWGRRRSLGVRIETQINDSIFKLFFILNFQLDSYISPNSTVHLQYLRQNTTTNVYCRSRHVPPITTFFHNGTLCAFSRRGQGLCYHDFGGPLAANGQLVGVVSWARPCARGVPDGFARISTFVDWIQRVSGVAAV